MTDGKNILILFYSQSGESRRFVDQLLVDLNSEGQHASSFEIRSTPNFPLPWKLGYFFSLMPPTIMESLGQAHGFDLVTNTFELPKRQWDLVVLVYPVWFLSPALPVQIFVKGLPLGQFAGTPAITVCVCRKMWLFSRDIMSSILPRTGLVETDRLVLCHQAKSFFVSLFATPYSLIFQGKNQEKIRAASLSQFDIGYCARRICKFAAEEPRHHLPQDLVKQIPPHYKYFYMEVVARYVFEKLAYLINTCAEAEGKAARLLSLSIPLTIFLIILCLPILKIFDLISRNGMYYKSYRYLTARYAIKLP